MIVRDWGEFWWNDITGAHQVVTKVVNALMEHSTVLIDIPVDLPWRHQMRSAAEDEFRRLTGLMDILIETIDATDDVPPSMQPGRFLLDRFAPNKTVRNGYRERSQRSIQDYIKENAVLKNRVIWVKGLTNAQATEWTSFCRNFSSDSVEDGAFVLEVPDGVHRQDCSKLFPVRLLECFSCYDVQLLNSFILDEQSVLSIEWKRYLSTAAAIICDTDAEVSSCILEAIKPRKQSPLDVIAELASLEKYAKRGTDKKSNHVFAHYRKQNSKELEKRLWEAQVQTLFPLIEIERIRIISIFQRELQATLEQHHIVQFEVKLTHAIQIEWGTLSYMVRKYKCIRDQDAIDRIELLHACRNHLAHGHCCSTQEVCSILDEKFR